MIIVIIAKFFVIFTKILIPSMNVNIKKQDSSKGLVYIISNRIKHVVIKRKRVVVLLKLPGLITSALKSIENFWANMNSFQ